MEKMEFEKCLDNCHEVTRRGIAKISSRVIYGECTGSYPSVEDIAECFDPVIREALIEMDDWQNRCKNLTVQLIELRQRCGVQS